MSFCTCGEPYYPESTGEGPCHKTCRGCKEIIPDDNNPIASEYDMCLQCMSESLEDAEKMQEFVKFGKKLFNKEIKWDHVKNDMINWFEIMEAFNN